MTDLSPDALIEAAAQGALDQQEALDRAQQARDARTVAIWKLRQATRWSSSKIARKIAERLRERGVTDLDGIGVSHDNVRRVVGGPDPTL